MEWVDAIVVAVATDAEEVVLVEFAESVVESVDLLAQFGPQPGPDQVGLTGDG